MREKQFAAFYVKATLDLSPSLRQALKMKVPSRSASVPFLTEDELARPLDPQESFPSVALRAARRVAAFYGASIADTLAVSCGQLIDLIRSVQWLPCAGSGAAVLVLWHALRLSQE
jgi:hypothetical protein